ncbi:glycosyltransferase family 4 protein [Microbacterium gorillae]|uniref:glycosyltransferase family 4 protein n=1 Tax=Microbacterium gorillae TaxID=1231063 RepID=UPI000693CFDF|nr:glycosyltransferase family 1 protein [Microbacterium gorillae]
MRILFDGFWWADGPAANRTVQREFVLAWHAAFPDDEIVLAVRRDDHSPVPPSVEVVRTRLWPQAVANLVELPVLARRARADVVVAHNFAPLLGRSVSFIHDAMFVDHPAWFTRFERTYFAAMLPSARRAAVVATSTRTEADRITRLAPRLAPITVTGLAVPPALAEAVPARPIDLDVDGFALTVGRLNVRKNLERLIEGAGEAQRITARTPLLVVGSSEHSGVSGTLPPAIDALRDSGRVRFLGRLSDAELAWLYAHADLTVSLTRDEGFGMTPIEAAHFGSPLLVSDIPVHHETVGDYARFVDPDAPAGEIGAAIDASWGARPAETASAAVRARWTWDRAVRALRTEL